MAGTLLDELMNASVNEQFERDADLWAKMIADPNQKAQAAVMKRIFLLMKYGLKISIDGKTFSNPQDLIPLAAYLSHGQRVEITIPPTKKGENPHQLWNWITTGDPNFRGLVNKNMSTAKSSDEMKKKDPDAFIFNRAGSTHHAKRKPSSDPKARTVKEVKLKWYDPTNIGKFIRNKFSGISPNWGMNIALGGTSEKKPMVTGDEGHMLLYYKPPTENKPARGGKPEKPGKPGVIYIGGETCEYGKQSSLGHGHDFMGKAGKFSNTKGLKWSDKVFRRKLIKQGIEPPSSLNSFTITAPPLEMLNALENVKDKTDFREVLKEPPSTAVHRELRIEPEPPKQNKVQRVNNSVAKIFLGLGLTKITKPITSQSKHKQTEEKVAEKSVVHKTPASSNPNIKSGDKSKKSRDDLVLQDLGDDVKASYRK